MKNLIHLMLIIFGFSLFACNDGETESSPETSEMEQSEALSNALLDKLLGMTIQYTYSGGNSYAISLKKDGLRYQFRTGSKPDKWWGPFDYHHMPSPSGQEHVIAWYEDGYGDFVTLVVNFDKDELVGSAVLPTGKKQPHIHFEKAQIEKVSFKK